MLLKWLSPYPEANAALELLVREARGALRGDLASVIAYGSVVFEDFAPGYGDLDFLAVVRREIPAEKAGELIELRRPIRSGRYGQVATMLEGPFLPLFMLDAVQAGRAVWWGTSGERLWERNELGPLVMHTIRERGTTVWGDEVRHLLRRLGPGDVAGEARKLAEMVRRNGKGGTLHSVDWLLMVARMLRLLRTGEMGSKSEAAQWGLDMARGAWRTQLPRARRVRLNPASAREPDTAAWIESLTPFIQEARAELEEELQAHRDA